MTAVTNPAFQDRPISCWAEARSTSLEIAIAISQLAAKRFTRGSEAYMEEMQKIWSSRDPYRMSEVLGRAFTMAPHLAELFWGPEKFEFWCCDVDSLEIRFNP